MDFPVDAGGQRIANLADGLVSLKLQLAFAFRNGPVSYTHLDVYKRQQWR